MVDQSFDIDNAAKDFQALANKIRLQILINLYNAEKAGIQLNMLEAMDPYQDLPRSSITNHIQVLEASRYIQREKVGREVKLKLDPNWDHKVRDFINMLDL